MYEYELKNKKTNEIKFAYGYNDKNVFERNNLIREEWNIVIRDYVS